MSELNKICLLAHPPVLSNVTQDSCPKITLEKLTYMYFLVQLLFFEIFALVKEGCLPIHKVFYTFCPLLLQFLLFQKPDYCLKVVILLLLEIMFISRNQVLKAYSFALSS